MTSCSARTLCATSRPSLTTTPDGACSYGWTVYSTCHLRRVWVSLASVTRVVGIVSTLCYLHYVVDIDSKHQPAAYDSWLGTHC